MQEPIAYTSSRIFTGEEWLHRHAVIVQGGIIRDLIDMDALSSGMMMESLGDNVLCPAFIDLQIYGAYGRLLAAYPEAASLSRLKDYCEEGGAAWFLPTVATNTLDVFHRCIDAVRDYWARGGTGVPGLHLEGPWINPRKKGAHREDCIHAPTVEEVSKLLEYGKGVIRMITLAPEQCDTEVLSLIRSHGIVISAGHSDATYAEAMTGFQRGITAITHLYNAMSPLQHRSPGLVGAALDHPSAMASIIPDGYHVDFAAIRIAEKIMRGRLFAITDAVTETDRGYYQHYPAGDKYESGGILSGSALNMGKALKNLVNRAGIGLDEALRMCSLYPARVLGVNAGLIRKDYPSEMVVLNKDLEVLKRVG